MKMRTFLLGKNHPQNAAIMTYFEKRFRSFNARNFGSIDQRAAKLLAVKVGVLKKSDLIFIGFI